MVDFDNLNNITTFELNNTLINNTNEIVPVLIDNTNTVSGGYYGLWVMFAMFVFFAIFIYRDDGDIKMDITRTLMFSSGFVSIIGVVAVVTTIFNSFAHVAWFVTIFAITAIATYFLKKKGL